MTKTDQLRLEWESVTMTRDDYLQLRREYEPDRARLIIIAESPPASGKYFYNPKGVPSEPLFAAMMRQLGIYPSTKEEGLRAFQRTGWVLIDATYEPVTTTRDEVITLGYAQLLDDLATLLDDPATPLVLVKKNV